MRIQFVLILVINIISLSLKEIKAQSDSAQTILPKIELKGYIDYFYVYDFNQPLKDYRQKFFFNYNRHNEFNLNHSFISVSVRHHKYRANFTIQAGTYVIDNYTNEPDFLKNIFEANTGISLNKHNNLWLDVGIFSSHIGFESVNSFDNWTLTRSILAENSPYYLTGAKLTYNPKKNVELNALIFNGWQHIQKVKGNSLPSFGSQLKVLPSEKITLNWSTFIGSDDPDTLRRMRYFNNFYSQFNFTEKLNLITGFDIGSQQHKKNSSSFDIWFSPIIIVQYGLNKDLKTVFRVEYYQDETGIIIPITIKKGFRTTGLSVKFHSSPFQSILWKLEGRWLNNKNKIFETKTTPSSNNFIIGTSLSIKL